MSHVVESAASRRHRRNRRTAILFLVLVALLAGAFYYAAQYFNRPSTPAASSGCPTGQSTVAAENPPLAPHQVTVNVYNATNRAGLAAATAKDIKARGYVIGQVANDPLKKKIQAPAEVRFGPNGKAGSELVAKLVEGAVPTQDTRGDASVDLVIGNGFKALVAAPATTTASTPTVANPC